MNDPLSEALGTRPNMIKKAKMNLLDANDIGKADPAWKKLGERAMRILMKLFWTLYVTSRAEYDVPPLVVEWHGVGHAFGVP